MADGDVQTSWWQSAREGTWEGCANGRTWIGLTVPSKTRLRLKCNSPVRKTKENNTCSLREVIQLPLAKTMGLHRPKAIDDPCRGPRTDYPCWTWRWRTGMLLMVAAALTAVMPTAGAATHAWGHLGRPWPTAAAGAIGFAASPSSATVRCPFSRRNQYHLRLSAASGGGSAYGSSSGGSPHRHSSRTCLRPPAISFWGQLHDQHRCQTHQHYGCQVTAQPLPVGYGGRASPLSARAGVGVGMNVSSSTEILQSVEGEETTVTLTEAGGRPHTATSRARISAANKGKEPWNKGGRHSEETRRKIAEGARNAARKRREATALSLVRGGDAVAPG